VIFQLQQATSTEKRFSEKFEVATFPFEQVGERERRRKGHVVRMRGRRASHGSVEDPREPRRHLRRQCIGTYVEGWHAESANIWGSFTSCIDWPVTAFLLDQIQKMNPNTHPRRAHWVRQVWRPSRYTKSMTGEDEDKGLGRRKSSVSCDNTRRGKGRTTYASGEGAHSTSSIAQN